jgi:DNA-binding MarR family transcriptional regulator
MNKPNNSFEAVKLVLDKAPKDLTLVQRLVLIQIAHHYPTPHLSQKTLAAEIGIKRVDTVYKAIKVLVDRGCLIVKRQGQMKANKYLLNYGYIDTVETAILTTRQTGNHDTRQTAIKQTIKQTSKQSDLVFSSVPGSPFWNVIAERRPDLSFVERKEFLEFFENSRDGRWWIDNAHTDSKLVDACLACFPSAKGEISEH